MSSIKPIFLLADSQLLFWREDGKPFLARVRALLDEDAETTGHGANGGGTKAAYLGASNGDAPEFYELFVAAMEQIGVADCRHIPAKPSDEDMAFLAQAALIARSTHSANIVRFGRPVRASCRACSDTWVTQRCRGTGAGDMIPEVDEFAAS